MLLSQGVKPSPATCPSPRQGNLHQVPVQLIPFPNCRWAHICRHCSRSTKLWSVILQAQSPLNLDCFQHYLACCPNRQWSESLLQGIHKGVDIGYQGNRKTIWSGNWKSALDNGSVVSEYLMTEVTLGRRAEPFNQLPFHTYIRLPMGIVIKKCSDLPSIASSMICHGFLGTVAMTTLTHTSTAVSMLPLTKQFS